MTDQHNSTNNSTTQQPLGLAGKMAQSFIHSPLSPLLFIAMLLMGILGLVLTPRQEDPQISVPMVDIFVQYSGASSQQVARLAIDPLQRIMSEIPGVDHVYSAAERGRGMVTVQFDVGEQMENSIFKVHDKLQSNLDKIPPGVSMPLVKPKGIDDVPVVTLTLWSDNVDDGALRTLALDVMQSLKEIEDTGQSFVVGGRTEQVLVEINPERLSSFGITLGQVAQTIQAANTESPAGYVEALNRHFTVYTGTFLESADDVAKLVVGTYQGSPIYVRDIADVIKGPEKETQQFTHFFSGQSYHYEQHKGEENPSKAPVIDAQPSVTIAIAKKIGTNGVAVANDILAHVEKLKGTVIPTNVHVEVTRNYGQTANDKVNDLIKKLFIATGAVTVLVFFALGWRPALVVTLVIPVVILITVFSAWILGYTIDRVSLFALIFSIGILVDDAIVVIENIYRRWLLKGEMDTPTAVDAVREVGNPTILATFTVVAALLPMGFVSGMMGPYMEPIPALGSVAMIFSLFAAFIFTPWLAMRFKPSLAGLHKAEKTEHHQSQKLEKLFRRILPPLFTNRLIGSTFLLLLIVAFVAACSLFYFKVVEVKMLPLDNKPEFNVFINMPEGTSLFDTTNLTHTIARKLREIPEVTAMQTYVGTSQPFDFNGMVRHYYLRNQPWQADIHVQLKDKKDRPHHSSHQIATEARKMLHAMLKDSPVKLTVVEMPPGPPVLQAVVAEIYGPDETTRRLVAQTMTQAFEQAEILDDVDNYMVDMDGKMNILHEFWRFEIDTEKAVRHGIAVETINNNLSMALGNFKLGDVKTTTLEPTYIVMQVPIEERSQLNSLYDLPIPSTMGSTVPLAELGNFVRVKIDPIIYQKDLRPVEYVVGDSVGIHTDHNKYHLGAPIYGMREVEAILKDYVTPDGVKLMEAGCKTYFHVIPLCERYLGPPVTKGISGFEWSGEWTVTYETFRDMGAAFMVAMVLIYILVVWLFGNFIAPAIIMLPIPLTLLGIIPGHWLLGAEFTATSMIGWIALAGIIVRNSILLVDYSIHELQQGTSLRNAVILACKTRTRPIMITALALVAGSTVILFDPIFQGMAISLLFGVLVSTILTLVVIPLGCISVGTKALCEHVCDVEDEFTTGSYKRVVESEYRMPLWMVLWSKIIGIIFWIINAIQMIYYIIRGIFLLIWSIIVGFWHKLTAGFRSPPPSGSGGNTPPQSTPPRNDDGNTTVASQQTTSPPSKESSSTPQNSANDTQAAIIIEKQTEEEVHHVATQDVIPSQPIPEVLEQPPVAETIATRAVPIIAKEQPTIDTTVHLDPNAPVVDTTTSDNIQPTEHSLEVEEVENDPTDDTKPASTNTRKQKKKSTRRGIRLKTDLKSGEIEEDNSVDKDKKDE